MSWRPPRTTRGDWNEDLQFIGDLSQSRWEQGRVQFGRNGSPVAAVLCVNTLDCSVREGPNDPGQIRMVEGTVKEAVGIAERESLSETVIELVQN